jgi:hypothetical protein
MVAIKSNHDASHLWEADIITKSALVRSAAESVQRQQVLEQSKNGTSATSTINDAAMGVLKVTTPLAVRELEQGAVARPVESLNDVYSSKGVLVAGAHKIGSLLRASV